MISVGVSMRRSGEEREREMEMEMEICSVEYIVEYTVDAIEPAPDADGSGRSPAAPKSIL
jgi:hypothetical protein